MKVTATVDTQEFNGALKRYAKETGRSMGEVVRRACVFIAKAYMVSTQPREQTSSTDGNFRKKKGEVIYNGKADHKLGKNAVMRDIGRVFGTYQQAFTEIKQQSENAAKGFAKATKLGDWAEAERILQSAGGRNRNAEVGAFDGQLHKAARRNGSVKRQRVARFVDKKELEAYKKKIAARVGFAKSAWFHLGAKFGRMTNVPAWIKRHDAPGTALDHTKKVNPGAIMTSLVRYASEILPASKQAEAMKYARGRMITMMEEELKAKARKANLAK